jgi:hypothetical protein
VLFSSELGIVDRMCSSGWCTAGLGLEVFKNCRLSVLPGTNTTPEATDQAALSA